MSAYRTLGPLSLSTGNKLDSRRRGAIVREQPHPFLYLFLSNPLSIPHQHQCRCRCFTGPHVTVAVVWSREPTVCDRGGRKLRSPHHQAGQGTHVPSHGNFAGLSPNTTGLPLLCLCLCLPACLPGAEICELMVEHWLGHLSRRFCVPLLALFFSERGPDRRYQGRLICTSTNATFQHT